MVDLLKSFPYSSPREIQKRALEKLGENWDKFDVFVISAPTAFGKTAVARTLINAFNQVSVITPTNLLVEQFREEFPATPTLSRLDSYHCETWRRPCSTTRGKLKKFCTGCHCGKDLATAKYRRGPGVYNYHTYLAQRLHRRVLVVDEAHNLVPFIKERLAVTIWQHDYKYPSSMYSPEAMQRWVETLSPQRRHHQKIQLLEEAVSSPKPRYTPHRSRASFNGKGTVRGEPEDRDCIKLLPVSIRDAPPMFWPREVEKIVLLSATIAPKDIETLGLSRRRVLYIQCESPIPASQRPIVAHDVAAVNRQNLIPATQAIASFIHNTLAPAHPNQKGLVHATYAQATILSELLGHEPRYLFHNRHDRSEVYRRFRDSPAESGVILVASGMYEGIDLPEDLGRWQAIAKIPWPSLGDPSVRILSENDPDWYLWETWKIVMQACGRICRTPDDFGVSYILDSSFRRLQREGIYMVPLWYQDGLREGGSLE